MELVIDANIVMSVLIAPQATTAELLFSDELTLYAPEYSLDEFEKHKEEILEKSELNETDFDLFLSIVSSRINFVPFDEFRFFIEKAKDISPDQNDTEYFAVALKQNCALWTNDKKLKEQSNIKVFSTSDLMVEMDFL